jgi:hypothetical protein
MLSEAEQLEILNSYFEWSGGGLPESHEQVAEFLNATDIATRFDTIEVAHYLCTEILSD